MNKDQENKNKDKNILNYESDYGKELHKKDLMEDVRKKEIKKYEKDHEKQFHERKDSKEKINIYVDNLNIDKFDNSTDNSNYGNNIAPSGQSNLDLNMDWSIKSSEPLYNNNGLQLSKSNNIKEEEIKNSKIYKDMENNYKEALKERNQEIEGLRKDLIEANHKNKNLIKLKKILISIINNFKNKTLTDETIDLIKIFIDEDVDDNE